MFANMGCVAATAEDASERDADGEAAWGPAPVLGPDPSGQPARYAIVLAHGFDSSGSSAFPGVADALAADGHAVYEGDVPPFASADDRATYLANVVDQAVADGYARVNIVAHSMGGLDARALVSTLGYGDRVASITTISTPHRGTLVADAALGLADDLGASDEVLDRLAELWGESYSDLADDSDFRAALVDLSESSSDDWNAAHPDDPRVSYFSWAGASGVLGFADPGTDDDCRGAWLTDASGDAPPTDRMSALLTPLSAIAGHGTDLYPNDGVVRVTSAEWGGFMGCIPADHLKEPGSSSAPGPNTHTGYDAVRFYRDWAFYLASQGY